MSFLRLGALWALPIILLPIIIHLIHRRRYPTQPWAAMMFLRRAAASRRGPAKLRRWLILMVRTLIVAAVVFALARPLSSGMLSSGMFGAATGRLVGGTTSVILLDRSPSMQRRVDGGQTRQQVAAAGVAKTMKTVGAERAVLVDSVSAEPIKIDSTNGLLAGNGSPNEFLSRPADNAANIPEMISHAVGYLNANDVSVADVWVCSDRSRNDWRPDSPQWQQVNEAAQQLGDGVRFHLLGFDSDRQVNSSVSVSEVRWVDSDRADSDRAESAQGRAVSITVAVKRDDIGDTVVPVRITLDGVTTTVDVDVKQGVGKLTDVIIDAPSESDSVTGMASIASDVNPADDRYFFSLSSENRRSIGLITDQTCVALEVVVGVLGSLVRIDAVENQNEDMKSGEGQVGHERLALDGLSCLVWQGRLPDSERAEQLKDFLQQGGSVVFFPPSQTDPQREFSGVRWDRWVRDKLQSVTFDDLDFPIESHCLMTGQLVSLARVQQQPLIGKLRVGNGTAWFCGADVMNDDGLFVKHGVALYGLISESLDASSLQSNADQGLVAGTVGPGTVNPAVLGGTPDDVTLKRIVPAGDPASATFEFGHHAGVYSYQHSDQGPTSTFAINRPLEESESDFVDDDQLSQITPDIQWNRVLVGPGDSASDGGFVREIWGAFWLIVVIGMLAESCLSLPRRLRGDGP